MNDRAAQAVIGIVFVYMAWVLTALIDNVQYERSVLVELVQRVATLEAGCPQ